MSSSSAGPSIRAAQLKANVEALSLLGNDAAVIRRSLSPELLAQIDDALRIAWLPIEIDMALSAAVMRVCGRSSMRRWARESMLVSIEAPFLGPILKGMRSVGLTPRRVLNRIPMAWGLVFRGCGHLELALDNEDGVGSELDHEHGSLSLVHLEAPTQLLRSEMTEGIAGVFAGALVIGGAREENARVELEVDSDGNSVRYRCTW